MNPDILQAIATGLVTILGFFMFYDSKKRIEAVLTYDYKSCYPEKLKMEV